MNNSILQQRDKPTLRFGISPDTWRTLILLFWAALICFVVVGSLVSAASPVIIAVGRLHINDKILHFWAYLTLSTLPLVGFRDRHRALTAGLSMFVLGVLLEAGQHFSPGRAVEFGDVVANGFGVSCGVLFAFVIRAFGRRVLL